MEAFLVGMHQPCDAWRVPMACISINRLRTRKGPFRPPPLGWIMDSGAFTELNKHGCYRHTALEFALDAARWAYLVPGLKAVVAQDYMCEPFVLAKTGRTIAEHQQLTLERYDELLEAWELLVIPDVPILPVLQGFAPADYVAHIRAYGHRLAPGMWAGVGSVCKRQGDPSAILAVLQAIKAERPDLRLHGFGVKSIALSDPRVRELLHTADSMAWSFAARYEGRDRNSPLEALAYYDRVMQAA